MLLSVIVHSLLSCFFFFNRTATTEIYTYLHTLSLHDALPIYARRAGRIRFRAPHLAVGAAARPERSAVAHVAAHRNGRRSGLERRLAQRDRKSTRLNSSTNAQLVCRLLLAKKNPQTYSSISIYSTKNKRNTINTQNITP